MPVERTIHVITKKDSIPPSKLERGERLAGIISKIGIPLLVAVIAWVGHNAITEKEARTKDRHLAKEYVEIAIGLLNAPRKDGDDAQVDQRLRRWAADVLAWGSPVEMNPSLKDALVAGQTTLPLPGSPGIPQLTLLGQSQPRISKLSEDCILLLFAEVYGSEQPGAIDPMLFVTATWTTGGMARSRRFEQSLRSLEPGKRFARRFYVDGVNKTLGITVAPRNADTWYSIFDHFQDRDLAKNPFLDLMVE